LSLQITLTLPNVSTLGSFFTIAERFDILRTPRARVTVTTIGRPSGMAATASETVREFTTIENVSQAREAGKNARN
jgi:hypothetical protein